MPSSSSHNVSVQRDGPVYTVILDRREHRNAVNRATADQLTAAFVEFENCSQSKVAVLWGAGGSLCSGADLKAFAKGEGNRLQPDGDGPMGPTRMHLSKPVIAAIEGHAVAGGLELALWCDLRVAARNATLGVYCRRFGVPLIDGGSVRLPRIVGMGRALDLILTGRAVGADEALAIGLISRISAPRKAREEAEKLAHLIAGVPSKAMLGDRESAYEQWGLSYENALQKEFQIGEGALEEGLEGAQGFAKGAGRHGRFVK